MKTTVYACAVLAIAFLIPLPSAAQGYYGENGSRLNSIVHFPTGEHALRQDYRNNGKVMSAIDSLLRTPSFAERIDSLLIVGAASPTGRKSRNDELAQLRGPALHDWLMQQHPALTEHIPVRTESIGIDYEGFAVLRNDKALNLTVRQVWELLQYACLTFRMKDGSYVQPCDTVYLTRTDTVYVERIVTVPAAGEPQPAKRADKWVLLQPFANSVSYYGTAEKGKVYLAVKNNMLYDLALLPNFSVECYLGKRWSAALSGYLSWWILGKDGDNTPRWWWHHIQAAQVEGKYWLWSPHPLQGYAVGVYAMAGSYDLRFLAKHATTNGVLSDFSWSAGLNFTFSRPLSRRFNIEFGLSAGYVAGEYHEYNYSERYGQWAKRSTKIRHYMGITGASASIVWLPFNYNKNKNKK